MKSRFYLLLCTLLSLYVVACQNGNDNVFLGSTSGLQGLQLLAPGQGPVSGQGQADEIVLREFLGVDTSGLSLQTQRPIVGSEPQRAIDVFIVPGGALPPGTDFTEPHLPTTPNPEILVLEESFFVYFVDLFPLNRDAVESQLLLVRTTDGALFSFSTFNEPGIGGRYLFSGSRSEEQLLYTHVFQKDLRAVRDQDFSNLFNARSQPPSQRRFLGRTDVGPENDDGIQLGGLFVRTDDVGLPSGRKNIGVASEVLRDGVFDGEIDLIEDVENIFLPRFSSPLLRTAVQNAIMESASGLGPEDGYFFYLTGHGNLASTEPTGSMVVLTRQGGAKHWLKWERVCEWLQTYVKCCDIYVVTDACFSGAAHDIFKNWPRRPHQQVTVATAVDDRPCVDLGFNIPALQTGCMWGKINAGLREAAAAAEGLPIPLGEIHDVLLDSQVSPAELEEKMCEIIVQENPNPSEKRLSDKQNYSLRFKPSRHSTITPDTPLPSPSPTATATPSPTPTPSETPTPETERVDTPDDINNLDEGVKESIENWLRGLQNPQELQFAYAPGYDYANRNFADILSETQGLSQELIANLVIRYEPSDRTVTALSRSYITDASNLPFSPSSGQQEVFEVGYFAHEFGTFGGEVRIQKEARVRSLIKYRPASSGQAFPKQPKFQRLEILGTEVGGLHVGQTPAPVDFDSQEFRVEPETRIPFTLEFFETPDSVEVDIDGRSTFLMPDSEGRYSGSIEAPESPGDYRLEFRANKRRSGSNGVSSILTLRNVEIQVRREGGGVGGGPSLASLFDSLRELRDANPQPGELERVYRADYNFAGQDRSDLNVEVQTRFLNLREDFFETIGLDFDENINQGTAQTRSEYSGQTTVGPLTFDLDLELTESFFASEENGELKFAKQLEVRRAAVQKTQGSVGLEFTEQPEFSQVRINGELLPDDGVQRLDEVVLEPNQPFTLEVQWPAPSTPGIVPSMSLRIDNLVLNLQPVVNTQTWRAQGTAPDFVDNAKLELSATFLRFQGFEQFTRITGQNWALRAR